jgi:hypothetical protein
MMIELKMEKYFVRNFLFVFVCENYEHVKIVKLRTSV